MIYMIFELYLIAFIFKTTKNMIILPINKTAFTICCIIKNTMKYCFDRREIIRKFLDMKSFLYDIFMYLRNTNYQN